MSEVIVMSVPDALRAVIAEAKEAQYQAVLRLDLAEVDWLGNLILEGEDLLDRYPLLDN